MFLQALVLLAAFSDDTWYYHLRMIVITILITVNLFDIDVRSVANLILKLHFEKFFFSIMGQLFHDLGAGANQHTAESS